MDVLKGVPGREFVEKFTAFKDLRQKDEEAAAAKDAEEEKSENGQRSRPGDRSPRNCQGDRKLEELSRQQNQLRQRFRREVYELASFPRALQVSVAEFLVERNITWPSKLNPMERRSLVGVIGVDVSSPTFQPFAKDEKLSWAREAVRRAAENNDRAQRRKKGEGPVLVPPRVLIEVFGAKTRYLEHTAKDAAVQKALDAWSPHSAQLVIRLGEVGSISDR